MVTGDDDDGGGTPGHGGDRRCVIRRGEEMRWGSMAAARWTGPALLCSARQGQDRRWGSRSALGEERIHGGGQMDRDAMKFKLPKVRKVGMLDGVTIFWSGKVKSRMGLSSRATDIQLISLRSTYLNQVRKVGMLDGVII